MRCDQCKHWKPQAPKDEEYASDWDAGAIGYGLCEGVRERWKIQDEVPRVHLGDQATFEGYQQKRMAALKASRAYVQDGSEYMASLITAPDFFCALFAALTQNEQGGK